MSKIKKEIIAAVIIFAISICISIPIYLKDHREYESYVEKEEMNSKDWITTLPEAQGMNSKKLKLADEFMQKTDALSFLVVRHEKIVFERYYNNSTNGDYNNIFSVTKSFVSALLGIAIDEGYIKSIDDKISNYFPEYELQVKDSRKNDITIKHLLTMTPGFLEDFNGWVTSDNWVKYTFNLPLRYNPGERFQYANSASHLLSVILTRATGMNTADFAEKYLFVPLEIKEKKWMTDPQGFYTGYANLFLRPRDMAKFGQLYLDNGVRNGKRILSASWVEESTRKHVDTDLPKTMDTPVGYGYKWWTFKESGYDLYIAAGYGGQNICVIPKLDMVVVTTSIPVRGKSFSDEDRTRLLNEYIIPAVNDR